VKLQGEEFSLGCSPVLNTPQTIGSTQKYYVRLGIRRRQWNTIQQYPHFRWGDVAQGNLRSSRLVMGLSEEFKRGSIGSVSFRHDTVLSYRLEGSLKK